MSLKSNIIRPKTPLLLNLLVCSDFMRRMIADTILLSCITIVFKSKYDLGEGEDFVFYENNDH